MTMNRFISLHFFEIFFSERQVFQMKWIVGLGNPGRQYATTRHNIGFMAVDLMAEQLGISINLNKCKAQIGEGLVSGQKVVLMKPMTYMNLSGEAVRAYMDYYKVKLEDM